MACAQINWNELEFTEKLTVGISLNFYESKLETCSLTLSLASQWSAEVKAKFKLNWNGYVKSCASCLASSLNHIQIALTIVLAGLIVICSKIKCITRSDYTILCCTSHAWQSSPQLIPCMTYVAPPTKWCVA